MWNCDDAIDLARTQRFNGFSNLRGIFAAAGDDRGITSLVCFIFNRRRHRGKERVDKAGDHQADSVSTRTFQRTRLCIRAVIQFFSDGLDSFPSLFRNRRIISQCPRYGGYRNPTSAGDIPQRGRSSHHAMLLCVSRGNRFYVVQTFALFVNLNLVSTHLDCQVSQLTNLI